LIGLLVGKIPARARARVLREAGEEFGRSLGARASLKASGDVRTGLERVCNALGSLGFHASVQSLEGGTAILESATCPLRPLVVARPDANEIDHGMWAGLVERGIHGISADGVKAETPRCLSGDASCSILLSWGQRSARPSRRTVG
jgi:hypothetical protein